MPHSSMEDQQVYGTFQINVLDGAVDDPWNRGYVTVPKVTKTTRTFPLTDFRPEVFGSENGDAWSWSRSGELLKKYGFTAVKFDTSKLINAKEDEVQAQDFDDLDTLEEVYFPQVKESIMNLTGAKEVYITNSIVRRGEPAGGHTSAPKSVDTAASQEKQQTDQERADAAAATKNKKEEAEYKALHDNRPTHLKSTDNAKPSRTPHMDYTPLGARVSVRSWRTDIYEAALRSGVIQAEDAICTAAKVDVQSHDSDVAINSHYNNSPKDLGPRYAAYSIWRPLRTVTRDPLAMAPRYTFNNSPEFTFAPYQLRMLAAPSMNGDFLRELEALAMTEESANSISSNPKSQKRINDATLVPLSSTTPKWYYLAGQKPEEVIVLKFFDSAALRPDGVAAGSEMNEEAPGVPHGSPDVGDEAYGPARESIEVRCIAFW